MMLSIVIPALNEEEAIGIVVKKAKEIIGKLGIDAEVIVSDNRSTDKTAEIAKGLGARVIDAPKPGYGNALQSGFAVAKGEYIIMADADDSYNLEEIGPFIDKLNEGYEFVIGNRYKGHKIRAAMPFLHRYFGTPFLTFIMNALFKTGISDVNCGMRAFRKNTYQRMHCQSPGMEFATEMVIKAALNKFKIAEVPCNLYPDRRSRPPHLDTMRDGWRHLRFMVLFSPFAFFLVPGTLLFLFGLAGILVLPVKALNLDSNHLVTAALFLLTGAQIVEFGLAAKVFSHSEYFDRNDTIIGFLQRHFRLEKGLLLGAVITLVSTAVLIVLLLTFNQGMLANAALRIMRFKLGICGMTGLLFGLQIIFTSFLLSFFYMKVK